MLNGKFVATRNDHEDDGWFTKGKIYEFIDGLIIFDNGDKDKFVSIEGFENLNQCWKGILIPYNPQPKDLLQMGRIVKHRNGDMGFVLKGNIIYTGGTNNINRFNNDLNAINNIRLDIIEIYESTEESCFWHNKNNIPDIGELVWKREELTPEQIERKAIEQRQREIADEQKDLADRLAKLNDVK